MEQRDILGHGGDRLPQTLLRYLGDVLATDENASFLHVVESLDEGKQCRLAAARRTNQADPLAGFDVEIEIGEDLLPVRIMEGDIAQGDASAIASERLRLGAIAKGVGGQQRGERLGKARHMLRHVHQRHRKIPGGVEHGNTESADEHHLAWRDEALLPEQNRPSDQRQRQQDSDGGVQQSQPLQIEQAPLSRDYFATNGPVEAAMLAVNSAKRQDDGHVADHVDHLAVNRGGPMRILMVQGLAAGSDAEHGDDNRACDQAQRRRHRPTDRHEQNDG